MKTRIERIAFTITLMCCLLSIHNVQSTDLKTLHKKHHHGNSSNNNFQWKDGWILNWEKNALHNIKYDDDKIKRCTNNVKTNCRWRLPRYVPAREKLNYEQLIPKVIWQTWKSYDAAGEKHYHAVMSFINLNPEYEFHLFDDTDSLGFLCEFYPDAATIYQLFNAGAAKSDIWRLAIIHRYGGIYIDTDCRLNVPFREYIWPNASVVSGTDRNGDLHQWSLLYVPRHPFVINTLRSAIPLAIKMYLGKRGGTVIHTTGPDVYMKAAVQVMKANNCYDWLPTYKTREEEMADDLPNHYCNPAVGVLQIFRYGLSDKITFKAPGVGGGVGSTQGEMYNSTPYYHLTERKWSTLFKKSLSVTVEGTGESAERGDSKHDILVRVGECAHRDIHSALLAKLLLGW